ncbi:unnamed protein product, partial [Choristocarpus tenellus]
AVEVKLAAHEKSVGDICLLVEDITIQRHSSISLPKEAQVCLAGDMQRVAKLISTKADYDVIREIAKLENPETIGYDWDESRVERVRQTSTAKFLRDTRNALDRRAPHIHGNSRDIRDRFFGKMKDALKIALSKYIPTTPGATLFGKIKLQAKACLACDRPFTSCPAGRTAPTPDGGMTGAAVQPTSLPEENSYIKKDTFRPHTSHGRLGSPPRPGGASELFEPHTSVYSVMTGGRVSPGSPHVYRGGFKLPKHIRSPLHAEGDDQSAFSIGHSSALLHKAKAMSGL